MTYIRPNEAFFDSLNYPSGAGGTGEIDIALANTAYAIPAVAPTKSYILIMYNLSDTDIYWGFSPIVTGGIILPAGATSSVNIGKDSLLYVYCISAGKKINYTYREIYA